jgi:hypothetical protein
MAEKLDDMIEKLKNDLRRIAVCMEHSELWKSLMAAKPFSKSYEREAKELAKKVCDLNKEEDIVKTISRAAVGLNKLIEGKGAAAIELDISPLKLGVILKVLKSFEKTAKNLSGLASAIMIKEGEALARPPAQQAESKRAAESDKRPANPLTIMQPTQNHVPATGSSKDEKEEEKGNEDIKTNAAACVAKSDKEREAALKMEADDMIKARAQATSERVARRRAAALAAITAAGGIFPYYQRIRERLEKDPATRNADPTDFGWMDNIL